MKFLAIYVLIGLLYGILGLIFDRKKLKSLIIRWGDKICDDNCIYGDERVTFIIKLWVLVNLTAPLGEAIVWPYELMRCIKRDFFTKHKEDES